MAWDDQRDWTQAPEPVRLAGEDAPPWGFAADRPWPGTVRTRGSRRRSLWGSRDLVIVREVWTGHAWEVLGYEAPACVGLFQRTDAWGRPRVDLPGRPDAFPPLRPPPLWSQSVRFTGQESVEQRARRSIVCALQLSCREAPHQAALVMRVLQGLAEGATMWRTPLGPPVSAVELLAQESSMQSWSGPLPGAFPPTQWRPLVTHPDRAVRLWALRQMGHAAPGAASGTSSSAGVEAAA